MSRSKWKFNFLAQDLMLQRQSENLNEEDFILHNRNTYITEEMVGFTIRIYNGIRFFILKIEEDKIGFRLGEFAPTKKKAAQKKKLKLKLKKK